MRKYNTATLNSTAQIVKFANTVEARLQRMAGQLGRLKEDVAGMKAPPPEAEPEAKTKSKSRGGFVRASVLVALALAAMFVMAVTAQATNKKATYSRVSNPQQLRALLQDWADEFDDSWQIFTPVTTAPTAAEGKVYYNDTSNALYLCTDGSTWTLVDAGSGTSLDGAYNLGSAITVDGDSLTLTTTASVNNSVLALVGGETSNNNDTFTITHAGTGDAISIDGASTGNLIYDEDGNFTVSSAGIVTSAGGTCATADYLWDDTYDVSWDTSRNQLLFEDNAVLGIGGAHDAAADFTFKYDATDLNMEAAAANDMFRMGETTHFDFVIHGATNTNEITFDTDDAALVCTFDGFDLVINDDDIIEFGDSKEFSVYYDETTTDNLIFSALTGNDAVQIGDGTTVTDFVLQSTGDAAAQVTFDGSGDTNNGQLLVGADDHGIDTFFYGATASQVVTWDQSADTWYFGDDAEGVDVVFNADTTADLVMWDESDEALEAVGAQVHLDDDSQLQLGSTAGDVYMQFNGTNFLIDASTADEGMLIGDTTTGFDISYAFETAGTISTDYDADTMTFSDQMSLVFGTNSDASIMYDETTDDNLEILAASVGMSVTTNDFLITLDGAAADQFKVDATGTVAGNAIVLKTTLGGIQLNADGGTQGDITIDAADDMTLTAAGDLTLAVTGTLKGGGAEIDNIQATTEVVTGTTDTLTAAQSGQTIIYTMTGGACTITLPEADAAAVGAWFRLIDGDVTAGNDLTIDPEGAGTINGDTAGNYIKNETDSDGCECYIVCTAPDTWIAVMNIAVWTEE